MTDMPDLSTLPARMRYAAGVAAEASMRRWGLETGLWSAVSFIDFSGVFESYDEMDGASDEGED